jgi:hypothetical protein
MKTILRRVDRLEDRYAINSSDQPMVSLRILLSSPRKGPANLATSTCSRQLCAGNITEFVEIDGDDAGISENELEEFIAGVPVEVDQQVRAR